MVTGPYPAKTPSTPATVTSSEPILLMSQDIRAGGVVIYSDKMLDCRAVTNKGHVYFKIESSLDQAVNVQIVGNMLESFVRASDVGLSIPVPPNGNASITLLESQWCPWVGATVAVPFPPTQGRFNLWAITQE